MLIDPKFEFTVCLTKHKQWCMCTLWMFRGVVLFPKRITFLFSLFVEITPTCRDFWTHTLIGNFPQTTCIAFQSISTFCSCLQSLWTPPPAHCVFGWMQHSHTQYHNITSFNNIAERFNNMWYPGSPCAVYQCHWWQVCNTTTDRSTLLMSSLDRPMPLGLSKQSNSWTLSLTQRSLVSILCGWYWVWPILCWYYF